MVDYKKSNNSGQDDSLAETVVAVNRVTKVVKGGKRMSFSALVVVGDKHGSVGCGLGKAAEVQLSIQKATTHAKKNLVKVNLSNTTIPHEVLSKFGACRILLRPAGPGTGVIAGGGVRAVLEAVGIKDILSKSLGSTNPINTVYATIQGLKMLRTPQIVAQTLGKQEEKGI
ncbi:MAG: 30S ribosomal protein S5 [Elusimicrobiota bacterium]